MVVKNILQRVSDNSRAITILFIASLLLALILRIKFEINFPQISDDYAHLALKAKNFIEGHGFTYGRVNLKDISNIKYEAWNSWPNGFSILLVPLYYITGSLMNSLILAQIIGVVLLIFGFLRLFKALQLSRFTQSIFLLFIAFTPTPFSYLETTDLITAALFIWAAALTIEICTEEATNTWKKITIGIFVFFSAALRYACLSNIIIIPFSFILLSLLKKSRKNFYTGIFTLACAAIPTLIFYTVYKMPSDRSNVANAFIHFNLVEIFHFHFYWSSLKRFDAFPLKAFFFTLPLEFRLPLNHILIIKMVRLSEYLLSILIFGYLLWYYVKKRNWLSGIKENNRIDIFTLVSVIALIVVVLTISLQTLTMPLEPYNIPWMPKGMTAVFITRYFVLIIFSIQILFFYMLDAVWNKTINIKSAAAFVKVIFVSSMLFNLIYWCSTTYKYRAGDSEFSYWKQGKDMIALHNMLDLDAENHPGVNIVLATYRDFRDKNDPTIYSRSTNIAYQYDSIIQEKFNHTKPVILYTMMRGNKLTDQEKKFISDFNARPVFQWDSGSAYRAYLQ